MCGRIIIVKKKRRIAIRHPTESRGDVIMSDLTLKAKSSTFKMAAISMVTKVQTMLNLLQTSQIFAVMFPVYV
jgi:hypothetical protein